MSIPSPRMSDHIKVRAFGILTGMNGLAKDDSAYETSWFFQ